MQKRLAVIGAGPMGLTAALEGAMRGFEVTVFEGGEVGEAIRRWSPVRFFSPLGMNIPKSVREALGADAPPDDALLTGAEMVERVLLPLASSPLLAGRVLTHHKVISVGRRGLNRTDFAGHPLRSEKPFRLIVDSPEGETTFESDIVLDASGGYAQPNPFGAGCLPAAGERSVNGNVIRHLAMLYERLQQMSDARILLIGHGHSAANAILWLDALAQEHPSTRITWAVRTANRRVCMEVACDPLPQRDQTVNRANALSEAPPSHLTVKRRTTVEAISHNKATFDIRFSDGSSAEFDFVTAFTGARPDNTFVQELALEISPVTEGGARLYKAISSITDCLAVPKVTPADLQTGEPGFYFVGSRGYGRAPTFLLGTGIKQLDTIFESLGLP